MKIVLQGVVVVRGTPYVDGVIDVCTCDRTV
jgi:hypothetical protein